MVDLQPIHPDPKSFIGKYIISFDHKVIAKQFLWAGLIFLLLGGALAYLIRWQWAYPGQPVPILGAFLADSGGVVSPTAYNTIFTMHGLIMIFFAITPILIGAFGNFCIPLMIGARDMAFPTLNMLSFWVFVLSQVLILASFVVPMGSAGAGWTTYAPLSANAGMPGLGQTLVVAALFVTGIATIMGSVNYVTTVIRLRAPGMTWMRLPLTIWGLWLTAILNVLFVPVLGSAGLLLLLDRVAGTQFYAAGVSAVKGGGDPILFQHLFWIFGHPEVYILILPAWGFVGDFVSFFARKPAYFYKGSVYAMCAVSILSAVVYGHHMFVTGMNPMLGQTFQLLTLIISVPAELLFLNWLHTIWKGSNRFPAPMVYTLGVIFVFGLGGLTGLPLGTILTDLQLHDTMFVVGHFHLTMASASFLASFAALTFWFPKMFGRRMHEGMGKLHAWITIIGLTAVFCGQLIAGYAGHQRRLYDPYQYTFLEHLLPLNRAVSIFAFILIAAQIIFIVNFFRSIFAGEKAEENPWQATTLEWITPSPPPHHNFDVVPTVVRGPHELGNPEVIKRLGRDWIGQHEELPPLKEAPERPPHDRDGRRRPVSITSRERTDDGVHRDDHLHRGLGDDVRLPLLRLRSAPAGRPVLAPRRTAPAPDRDAGGEHAPPRALQRHDGAGAPQTRKGRPKVLGPALLATTLLGAGFIAMQYTIGADLYSAGLEPSAGPYASVFYGLAGIHGAHVVVGVLALVWLTLRAMLGAYNTPSHLPVRLWSMYWHFMGAVWVLMYVFVFIV